MPQDFDLSQFKATYFEECHDLLAQAEEHLGDLQTQLGDVDVEVLHAIFRCVHSIKGGAGAFDFTDLVSFSHIFETLLDKLREGALEITEELAECLILSNDVLVTLVQLAQTDEPVEESIWRPIANNLEAFTKGQTPSAISSPVTTAPPAPEKEPKNDFGGYSKTAEEEEEQGWGLFVDEPEETSTAQEDEEEQGWGLFDDEDDEDDVSSDPLYKIEFVPEAHLLQFANEPLLIIRELTSLGSLKTRVDTSKLKSLDELSSDISYLSWTFELRTARPVSDIEEVFEFVVDDCLLKITKIEKSEFSQEKTEQSLEEGPISSDINEEKAFVEEPVTQSPPKEIPVPPVSKETTVTKPAETKAVTAPKKATGQQGGANTATQTVSSIRVDLDRVDKLVNMVGELVITQAMLKQQSEDLADGAGHVMAQGFETLSAHTRELQESVMAIRMQPVKSVFARMPRLVRELSTKLNKKIDLITSGEMTEVDKTVIEQLMDPLTHMIRNSVDHGIETHEERAQTDKPERANILLSAEHRSGRIQIEISDDGKGINREKVLQKAIEKGIVDPDHSLEPEEIDDLIFAPGFSTADQVSDVSGRGVGMDVVRRNITSLGGRISVFCTPGEGTKFILSLPLTLAVLDGMIVKCGVEKYIIPLTAIIESIHPMKEELKTMVNGGSLVSVRGEYIRIVNLYSLFNVPEAVTDPSKALIVIVETERFGYVGIMVDELLGQQQVVIKSLEENYDPIAGISAATIMGNGKVSLILDVDGLAEMEHGNDKQRKYAAVQQQALLTGE